MLTLAWIEQQLEEARNGKNEPQNLRDFALLCIARYFLTEERRTVNEKANAEPAKPPIRMTDYCADLTTIPTVDQIGLAIRSAAMTASTPEEKRKLAVAQNWAEIIGQKS